METALEFGTPLSADFCVRHGGDFGHGLGDHRERNGVVGAGDASVCLVEVAKNLNRH